MSISIQHRAQRISHRNSPLGILGRLHGMLRLQRQRQHLSRLPEHMLKDLGISAEMATKEAARAPWDVPAYWRG